MALKQSTMLALGTKVPNFHLPEVVSGEIVSLDTYVGKKGLLVMFICNHCPYVVHIREELARIGNEYQTKGLGIVAICSNDVKSYPDDAPNLLKRMAEQLKFAFPFCYDESQETTKAFTAACTPDFFLFDQERSLVYRGQFDDSRPGNGMPVDGCDLRGALDAVVLGRTVSDDQKPSAGCNIKWKPGNVPQYA